MNQGENQNYQQNDSQNGAPQEDLGKQISDTVRSALHSGDLSRLKNIGPMVENSVKNTVNTAFGGTGSKPAGKNRQQNQMHSSHQSKGVQYSADQQPEQNRLPAQPAWRGQTKPAKKKATGPSQYTGLGRIIVGITGGVVLGISSIVSGGVGLATSISGVGAGGLVVSGVLLLATVGSGIFAATGFMANKRAKRVRTYCELLEQKPVIAFDELSAITGLTPDELRKDIKKSIKKGLMPGVRLDVKETCMVYGQESWQQYLAQEAAQKEIQRQEEQKQRLLQDPETAQLVLFKQEGTATVEKIREVNRAIPGEEISQKLLLLETTTSKIFSYVEQNPEKLPDTRRFMNYYLPTTLKLVEKYRHYEEMEIKVPNVVKAQKEIEQSLDSINLAFHNLLDRLYQDDTLDVSTDIEVLGTMMEQEGLMGNRFEMNQ